MSRTHNKAIMAKKAKGSNSMSVEAMAKFTQVANAADNRRQAEKILQREKALYERAKQKGCSKEVSAKGKRAKGVDWIDWLYSCVFPWKIFSLDNVSKSSRSKR